MEKKTQILSQHYYENSTDLAEPLKGFRGKLGVLRSLLITADVVCVYLYVSVKRMKTAGRHMR